MNSTDELIDAVRDWGREKGINNADKQLMKVFEETNEITREFVRGRYDTPEVVDSLGDSVVTLIILADILGYDIRDCLLEAYEVISKRTGKNVDGSFVKSEDLNGQAGRE
ncbi:MAG: MazG-like family protein [Candidatus Saccharimonadaceae bacterium]|nr:MazG-like family protein [Candidatus Saccharimonadaceae bacterium]